jgi:ADP-heptose:LPS heptosyltransferase
MPAGLIRRLTRRLVPRRGQSAFRQLIGQARAAQAAGRFPQAAEFYDLAAARAPGKAGPLVMSGHMHKEAGQPLIAEQRYLAALPLRPDDADLAMQFGHLYKRMARWDDADHWYRRAQSLAPTSDEPRAEIATVQRLRANALPDTMSDTDMQTLAPSLAPGAVDLIGVAAPGLVIKRLGRTEAGRWGNRPTLRGIEAVRGYLISAEPLAKVDLLIDGVPVAGEPLKTYPLANATDPALRKHVFNLWIDVSALPQGIRLVDLQFRTDAGHLQRYQHEVVIAPAIAEADYPASDALVSLAADGEGALDARIRARPSMVRPAARRLFPDGVRNVLVLRTDQVGDVVASIPAMRRLRQIVPDANIVGLVTAANVDLARTLGLFDELIVIDFPDDPQERRRIMPIETQVALRDRLAPYRFDIAIDLAASNVSRELLKLSGARYLHGSGGGDWPWLSGDTHLNTHDRWTGLDMVPHSAKVLAVVEALGAALDQHMPVIRRDDLKRDRLSAYGVGPQDRFAVLHAGARIVFSRWPFYSELARLLIERTDLKVVLMADDPAMREMLPPDLMASERLLFLDQRLPFDDFDAFLSFAEVVVGNDSGPKHLAALRGTNVVTVFTARINWAEWGQENIGTIISRRLPCAGCTIFHDAEECGKDFACIRDVRVEEVFGAVMALISTSEDHSNTNFPR